MRKINLAFISAFFMLVTPFTAFAETEIIPIWGYRLSGELQDIDSGTVLDIEDEESFGLILNFDASPGSQYELLYSSQSSNLSAGTTVPTNVLFDLDIEYLHVGGVNLYPINDKMKSFIGAGLGITRFTPKVAGYSSESEFSLNITGGLKHQFTKRLGLRIGLSLFATAVDSSSAIFCGGSGGCTVRFKGNFFTQYEGNVGLILKF